jgi:hypothetical protein
MDEGRPGLPLALIALLFAVVLFLQRGPLIRYLKIERM